MDEASYKNKFQEVIELVKGDISSIRTGRATPALVEDIICPAYGGQSMLKVVELATVHAPDNQTLTITPFDKSIIGDIKKGIESANVGINPSIDGEMIRISLPPMTGEDREKYVKLLAQKIESGKIMIRQIRGDVMKSIKEAHEKKELTDDEKFSEEKRLQEVVDEFVERIENLGEAKKKELLQV